VGYAFDRSSARSFDIDGRLKVRLAVLSQARVDRYLGSEIADGSKLGLDPAAEFLMYRPAAELARAVPSACGLPILSAHEPVDAVQFRPDLLIGSTLSDARFEAPHLLCSIAIWSADAIRDIETGKKGALSLGYHYEPDMRPGTAPDGTRFDGVMRDIVANHLALVDVPRIGAAGYLADRAPRRLEQRIKSFKPRLVCAA
jgi:uncharacterized protein